MSAHVLLYLLNKFGKRDKMLGSFTSLFATSLINAGAQMLDSVYHVTLKLFCNHVFIFIKQVEKNIECKALQIILWLFCNEFDKLNENLKTNESDHHVTLKLF